MEFKQKIFFIFLILVITGTAFYGGYSLGKWQCVICPPEYLDFSLFWEVYQELQERFVNPEKIDIQKVIYGAISGMVKSLEDPHTVFFSPQETKEFQESVRGQFQGVGMEIGIRNGQLQIISPFEGTPAQRAGLRAGDKILAVNDTLTAELAVEEVVKLIRGPKGTEVVLTILREGWEKSQDIKIIRDVIVIPSLKWELKNNDIAYIKLYHFSEKAASDFKIAAMEILNSPAKKIILDVRNNPGGYLEVAQDIAGWFLENNQIVVIEDFGGKRENREHKSYGNGKLGQYPIVVLINNGSASGSEILAGALRDNLGIKLIGEKSFGKGSIQELVALRDGSSLKVTIAKWLTPKGELITDKGLEPDIKVEMTDEDFEKERDPQLDKALEIINKM